MKKDLREKKKKKKKRERGEGPLFYTGEVAFEQPGTNQLGKP